MPTAARISALMAVLVGALGAYIFLNALVGHAYFLEYRDVILAVLSVIMIADGALVLLSRGVASLPVAWLFFLGLMAREFWNVWSSYNFSEAPIEAVYFAAAVFGVGMIGLVLSLLGQLKLRGQSAS